MTVLPVNDKPMIHNLSHNAFADSLLSSELYTGDVLATFRMSEDNFECKSLNSMYEREGDKYIVREKDKYKEAKCFFYRKIECDSFHIEVELTYQKVHHAWSGFNLLLTNKVDLEYESEEIGVVKVGHPARRKSFVKYNREFVKKFLSIQEGDVPTKMYIDLKGGILDVTLVDSKSNKDSFKVTLSNQFKVCPLYFVVAVEPGENQYYKWLFMNNVQLVGYRDQYGYLLVDYFNKPRKNYRPYQSDYMLEYISFANFLKEDKKNLINIIEKILQMKIYLIIKIDQYYVEDCEEYKKYHHEHEMMIYGLDKKRKLIFLEGFLSEGVFGTVSMSFKDFCNANMECDEDAIYLARVMSHETPFTINLGVLAKKYREYVDGYNSSELSGSWMPVEAGIFGMNIYNYFLSNTKLINSLAVDVRLSYTIWEHKRIMKERVEYLLKTQMLDDENMLRKMDEIYCLATELKNGAIYNRVKRRKRLGTKRITCILELLKKEEGQLYSQIADALENACF